MRVGIIRDGETSGATEAQTHVVFTLANVAGGEPVGLTARDSGDGTADGENGLIIG